MITMIWILVGVALFCAGVWGCSWIIAKYQLPKLVMWLVGGILLILIVFALIAVVHFLNGEPWHPFPGW